MADCLTSLPPEVLQQLFRHLSQYHLTNVIPLVCKVCRKAALAALQVVKAELSSQAMSDLFCTWLQAHGHKHLCQLEVLAGHQPVEVQLQFTQEAGHLQQLLITGGCYTCPPSFDALKQLTSLSMDGVTMGGFMLHNIASLSQLRSLSLHDVDFGIAIATSSRDKISSGAQKIWSNCKQLTSISIVRCDLDDAAVAQLTQQLTSLRHMDLSCNQLKAAATLAPLPDSLTFLNLSYNHVRFDVGKLLATRAAPVPAGSSTAGLDSMPQQQRLAPVCQHLLHLGIAMLSISQPRLLSGLVALTELQACMLQIPTADELLIAVRSLTNLENLDLSCTFNRNSGGPNMLADTVLLNEALQAMPRLKLLNLDGNRILPQSYLGPEEHRPPAPNVLMAKLPELKALLLNCLAGADLLLPNHRMRSADLQLLVDNCPKLQQLRVTGRIHESVTGSDMQPLLQLRSLSNLCVGGGLSIDDSVLSVFSQLTSLQQLDVMGIEQATNVGVMALTNLRQLTYLHVTSHSDSHNQLLQRLCPDGHWELFLRSKSGKPPDVWQQLLKRCNRIPACLRARQQQLEQALAIAQYGVSKQHKHAATAAKKAAALQKEIAQLRQQLAALQAKSSPGGP